jgi:integrase
VPLLGAVRLRDLSAEVVDAWIGELRAEAETGRSRLGPTSARGRSTKRAASSMAAEHRLFAAFYLGLVTGLRQGEVLASRAALSVERDRPVLKQLKTEYSDRVVTFGPVTAAVLTGHRALQEAETEFVGAGWIDTGLVFTTSLGGWVDPTNFGRLMDSLVEKAGVPRITPKGMRHTAQSIGRVVVGDDKVMPERP